MVKEVHIGAERRPDAYVSSLLLFLPLRLLGIADRATT